MLGALLLFLVLFLVYLLRSQSGKPGTQPEALQPETDRGVRGHDRGAVALGGNGAGGAYITRIGGVGAQGIGTASTLAGMAVVESMARVSAITGAPVQATTNDAIAYALTDNAIRRGYRRAGWSLESEGGEVRFLTHADPLAYVAGAAEVIDEQKVSSAVAVGSFGPEVLFLTEAHRRQGAHQIIGSSDAQALALMSITADHSIIGEEIFASGAYLDRRPTHAASLLAQDGLRWVLILLIVVGFIVANVFGIDWNSVLEIIP